MSPRAKILLSLVMGATCVTSLIMWALLVRSFIQDDTLVYKMLVTTVATTQTVKMYIMWTLLEE